MTLLIIATALGCGLVVGVFFAFSTFIMKALARLPAPQGIVAVQSINIVVINPLFMGALFGTGALCIVPLNNRLAPLDPQAESSATIWQDYLHRWTRWNHIRTAAALLACVELMSAKRDCIGHSDMDPSVRSKNSGIAQTTRSPRSH